MSRTPISRSPDLQRLADDGYNVDILEGHLLIRDVPYLSPAMKVGTGTLVSTLRLAGDVAIAPDTHVAMFEGECPCDANGKPLKHIISSGRQPLAPNLAIDHTFSSRPPTPYADYYDKMTHYIAMISAPAGLIDPEVSARKHAIVEASNDDSPFVYTDNASARAGIGSVNALLRDVSVAIVGLGGTGSYVLDYVAKTHVRYIDLYDADEFSQHNAFRSPGAATIDDLRARLTKVHYLSERYSKMHTGVRPHTVMIDESNVQDLRAANIIFICIDRAAEKARLIALLEEYGCTFIDVGMGVHLTDEKLHGILRVTTSTPHGRSHIHTGHRIPVGAAIGHDYDTNIQIAELNALNAALAVIKWKKLFGIFADLENELHSLYTIDGNHLLNEDHVGA